MARIDKGVAMTIFGIAGGLAGGIGSIILSRKLLPHKSVKTSTVVIASGVSFLASLGAIALIEGSKQPPTN